MTDEPPIERTDREEAEEAAYKRTMTSVLPKLHQVFDHIREYGLDDPETPVKTWAPVAAVYRLWHDESTKELTAHYHRYVQPLSVAGREEELPYAARDFVEEVKGWSEQEAIAEYIEAHNPPLDLPQKRAMHEAFDEVKRRAMEIDTTGVVPFRTKPSGDGQKGRG